MLSVIKGFFLGYFIGNGRDQEGFLFIECVIVI